MCTSVPKDECAGCGTRLDSYKYYHNGKLWCGDCYMAECAKEMMEGESWHTHVVPNRDMTVPVLYRPATIIQLTGKDKPGYGIVVKDCDGKFRAGYVGWKHTTKDTFDNALDWLLSHKSDSRNVKEELQAVSSHPNLIARLNMLHHMVDNIDPDVGASLSTNFEWIKGVLHELIAVADKLRKRI